MHEALVVLENKCMERKNGLECNKKKKRKLMNGSGYSGGCREGVLIFASMMGKHEEEFRFRRVSFRRVLHGCFFCGIR